MILNRIRKAIQISILAAGATLGSGAAHAAAYTGTWDPSYGSPFSNLGWKGTATFEVPDLCLSANLTGAIDFNTLCAYGSEMSITSATVELYLLNDPSTFETLVFDPTKSYVSSMDFSGDELTGVHGGFFLPMKPSNTSLDLGNTYFWLAFDGGPEMFHVTCDRHGRVGNLKDDKHGEYGEHEEHGGNWAWSYPSTTKKLKKGTVEDWVNSNYEGECGDIKSWGWNANGDLPGAGLMFTSLALTDPPTGIPEPASLALVLSALGAGWLARRRRS